MPSFQQKKGLSVHDEGGGCDMWLLQLQETGFASSRASSNSGATRAPRRQSDLRKDSVASADETNGSATHGLVGLL